MAYAKGKQAYGICDISGFRYKLKDMKRTWNGLLVGPDQWNAKHPQLEPRNHTADPEALFNPRPDKAADGGNGFIVISSPSITKNFSMLPNTIPSKFELAKLSSDVGSVSVVENDNSISETLGSQLITAYLGTITVSGNITESVSVTGQAGTSAIGSPTVSADTVYAVTVASYLGGNRYYIDGVVYPTLNLSEGETYKFDQSDGSNSGHPLRFSTTSDGSHGGGSEYTTGVTTNGTPGSSGAYTQITVAVGAPTLYYYCTNHSGMGGQANTP